MTVNQRRTLHRPMSRKGFPYIYISLRLLHQFILTLHRSVIIYHCASDLVMRYWKYPPCANDTWLWEEVLLSVNYYEFLFYWLWVHQLLIRLPCIHSFSTPFSNSFKSTDKNSPQVWKSLRAINSPWFLLIPSNSFETLNFICSTNNRSWCAETEILRILLVPRKVPFLIIRTSSNLTSAKDRPSTPSCSDWLHENIQSNSTCVLP